MSNVQARIDELALNNTTTYDRISGVYTIDRDGLRKIVEQFAMDVVHDKVLQAELFKEAFKLENEPIETSAT